MAAGRLTHVVAYSIEEGQRLAGFIPYCASRLGIELEAQLVFKERVSDDGAFIGAGYGTSAMHVGSWPYSDSQYQLQGGVPERVNIETLRLSTQLLLAAVQGIDARRASVLHEALW